MARPDPPSLRPHRNHEAAPSEIMERPDSVGRFSGRPRGLRSPRAVTVTARRSNGKAQSQCQLAVTEPRLVLQSCVYALQTRVLGSRGAQAQTPLHVGCGVATETPLVGT